MRIDLTIHKSGSVSGVPRAKVGVNRTSLLRGGNSIIARHTQNLARETSNRGREREMMRI